MENPGIKLSNEAGVREIVVSGQIDIREQDVPFHAIIRVGGYSGVELDLYEVHFEDFKGELTKKEKRNAYSRLDELFHTPSEKLDFSYQATVKRKGNK